MTFDAIFALLVEYFSLLGAAMQSRFNGFLWGAAFLSLAIGASQASAADLGLMASPAAVGSCSELVFVCENGKQYPLCPIAVSVAGEVVTASLHTGRGGAHVRLVPMGVGYRYAGRGIWLDGFRENALLNFGKHSQIACTLAH
ncbi:hypothetical protein [Bradyrhizobium iriomotense]|uniref:hypothetical protein n=1 Tax=Bradyrhizobium iriomotense TaxID=441950 RepID=UPI001FE392B4|nr:hypothetical protein [Bradyrhizobium iriomotense]